MTRALVCVILCSFTHFVGIYGTRPYLSLLASSLGASDVQVGLIAAVYSVVQAALALLVGRVVERYGSRLTLTCGGIFLLIGTAMLTQTHSLWMAALSSLLLGSSHVMVLITVQYLVTGLPSSARNTSVGLYTFANSAGTFVGPTFGGYMYEWLGANTSFWGTFVFGLLALAVSFGIPNVKSDPEDTSQQMSIRELLSDKKVLKLIIVSAMVLFTTEVIITYFPLYGQQLGLGSAAIGVVLGCSGMSQMLIRPFVGPLSKRIPRRSLLFTCLLGGGTGIVCYGFFSNYYVLIAVAIASGAFLGLLNPLMMITTVDASPSSQRSRVLSLRIMCNFAGQTASPLVFGLVSTLLGLAPVFWFSGAGMIICSGVIRRILPAGNKSQ